MNVSDGSIIGNDGKALIKCAAEWTPTFLKVTGNGVMRLGRRGKWQRRIVYLSGDTMSWSGVHRAFVVEAFFKINDSVTATQRSFRTRFGLYATDAVPDRKTILRWVSNVRAIGQHYQGNKVVGLGTLEHLKMCNESEHRYNSLQSVPLESTLLSWGFLIEL